MAVLRVIAALLPQILFLLDLGGSLDLLGGWNKTDTAFNVLIMLFLMTPVATASLLMAETIRFCKLRKCEAEKRSFLMPGLAILLFLEALAIDIFILSQVKM